MSGFNKKSIRAPLEWSILSAEYLENLAISLGYIHQPPYVDVSLTINGVTAQYHKNQNGKVFFIPAVDQFHSITTPLMIQCQRCPASETSNVFPHCAELTDENATLVTPAENSNSAMEYDPILPQAETSNNPSPLSVFSPSANNQLIMPSSLFHDDENNRVITLPISPLPPLFEEQQNQVEVMDICASTEISEEICEHGDSSLMEQDAVDKAVFFASSL